MTIAFRPDLLGGSVFSPLDGTAMALPSSAARSSLGDPVAVFATIKALTGLVIEVSFIATFTQRFFGAK